MRRRCTRDRRAAPGDGAEGILAVPAPGVGARIAVRLAPHEAERIDAVGIGDVRADPADALLAVLLSADFLTHLRKYTSGVKVAQRFGILTGGIFRDTLQS